MTGCPECIAPFAVGPTSQRRERLLAKTQMSSLEQILKPQSEIEERFLARRRRIPSLVLKILIKRPRKLRNLERLLSMNNQKLKKSKRRAKRGAKSVQNLILKTIEIQSSKINIS